jgi:hypothetical protein
MQERRHTRIGLILLRKSLHHQQQRLVELVLVLHHRVLYIPSNLNSVLGGGLKQRTRNRKKEKKKKRKKRKDKESII